jgi:hypothetical protein
MDKLKIHAKYTVYHHWFRLVVLFMVKNFLVTARRLLFEVYNRGTVCCRL